MLSLTKIKQAILGQTGFTMPELLCVLGLMGLVTVVVSMAVVQTEITMRETNAQLKATWDVETAGFWFRRDAVMAQSTDLPASGEEASTVTMEWLDRYKGNDAMHSVTYSANEGKLSRSYDGDVTVIAHNVTAVSFSYDDGIIRMVVTSLPLPDIASANAQATYEGRMRAIA